MTLSLLVVLTAPHLEDTHLVVAALRQHGGRDAGARYPRRADLQLCAGAHGQHAVDDDLLTDLSRDLLDLELLARDDLVLLAAGFDDRVHIKPFM